MKFITKPELIIALPTAIFVLLFSGLYLYYDMYLSSYFGQNPYEWFAFASTEKPPSAINILLSGFKDLLNLLTCLLLSYLSVVFIKNFGKKLTIKAGFGNTLAISVRLALSLVFLYSIYLFLRFIFINGYTFNLALDEIEPQIILFAGLYIIMIIPFVSVFNKRGFTRN